MAKLPSTSNNVTWGALDPGLSKRGIEQAQLLSEQLPADIEQVLCSPLLRARQTAEITTRSRNTRPVVITAFRERNVGVFEGLTQLEAQALHPTQWTRNITRHWQEAPTGGETIEAVALRVLDGLLALEQQYGDTPVALVAHGFVAKIIRALTRQSFEDFFNWQLANADRFMATSGTAELEHLHRISLRQLWENGQGGH
ncbi:MAG: histidine phosphatase family protein [Ectopseudomonas guguanensis]|uniref:histidine phosphatase family protein n=1 Tax=Ectopseudomonas guguanensis TaxID=1198456 RepID=UPI003918DB60